MPNVEILVAVTIDAKTCPVCGVNYGIDRALLERRMRDGGNWYCTNGHSLVVIEPEVDKLREQLATAQGNLEYYRERSERKAAEAEEARKQVRAQKAAKTRLLRRVTNGVCPCCNRSFADLGRHVQSKHPGQVVTAEQAIESGDVNHE